MTAARTIDPAEARRHVERGALLVCAYDDEAKCRDMLLEGSIALGELKTREGSLSRDQEIIFYCA